MPDYLDMLLASGEKQFGKRGCYVASEQERRMYGVELKPLALQYLIDSNIIPLQSIITLAGAPKTYKTSAVLAFAKMFYEEPYNGRASLIFTEGKMSASKIRSIVGSNVVDKLTNFPATSVQEWQDMANLVLNTAQEFSTKVKECSDSRGRDSKDYKDQHLPPIFVGIDSLTGSQSEAMIETVMKDGAPGKTFQDRAALITQWLNVWGSKIIGVPATVLITNHLKDAISSTPMPGGPQKITPGGVAPGYHTSLEIRVNKIKEIDKANIEGAELQWKTHFSSIGMDKRKINIPYIQTYSEAGDQIAWFDWDEALVRLIMELQEESRYKQLRELCGMTEISKTGVGKVYTCACLGIDRKKAMEDMATATVVAQGMQNNPEIKKQLQTIMHIQEHQFWHPNIEWEL